MREPLRVAREGLEKGERPIGVVVVPGNEIIASLQGGALNGFEL